MPFSAVPRVESTKFRCLKSRPSRFQMAAYEGIETKSSRRMASFDLENTRNDARTQEKNWKNNIFICERHFKAECILAGECWFVLCSISY